LIELIDEKKGEDIKVIDVSEITSIAKYIVIVTTMTNVHSNSLAKYVLEYFETKAPYMLLTKNPTYNNPWVLIDGADIIVHILLPEARNFYSLEKLYFKGKIIDKKLGVF
jgi:ribosome-associated protein